MGMLKKIARGTSRRLLSKLSISGSAKQLVLNAHGGSSGDDITHGGDRRSVGRRERARRLDQIQLATSKSTPDHSRHLRTKSAKKLSSQLRQTSAERNVGDGPNNSMHPQSLLMAIPKAVLNAAKNRLPPVQFHHVHGPNAQLSTNNCVARRTQSFCQALVFSNRVISPNERVYIKVLEIAKGWSGTIRFGFTSVDPATLRYQMPKHACPDMTKMGHTWARALADEVVRRNSVIHFSYTTNGFIHYGINNQDCGIFYANVNTQQNLWFVVDIYGLTAAVELIDPRVHNAGSADPEIDLMPANSSPNCLNVNEEALDFANNEQDSVAVAEAAINRYLSQGALYAEAMRSGRGAREVARSAYSAAQRAAENIASMTRKMDATNSRSKQHLSRQRLQAHPSIFYEHSSPPTNRRTGLSGRSSGRLDFTSPLAMGAAGDDSNRLPNLSSVMMPTAQQNIYSPMPSLNTHNEPPFNNSHLRRHQPNDTHDYYQITMSNIYNNATVANNIDTHQHYQPIAADLSPIQDHSILPATTTSENAICHQLEAVHLGNSTNTTSQQQVTKQQQIKTNNTPIAATRRRLQQHSGQSLSSASTSSPPQSSSSDAAPRTSGSHRRTDKARISQRPRQSSGDASNQIANDENKATNCSAKFTIKSTRSLLRKSANNNGALQKLQQPSSSTLNRDKNNSSPMSKDCPICFERPINCVLYQCGHMCTCYECGVKQWRTQSRTCPICRTVIKDVIKTYMS